MYLIYHIFLPPKLLYEDDFDSKYETILLDTTIDVLLKFKDCVTYDQNNIINLVITIVTNLRTVRDSDTMGAVSEGKLGNALRDLCKKDKHVSYNSCDFILLRLTR
jgi:hypothetical protein